MAEVSGDAGSEAKDIYFSSHPAPWANAPGFHPLEFGQTSPSWSWEQRDTVKTLALINSLPRASLFWSDSSQEQPLLFEVL